MNRTIRTILTAAAVGAAAFAVTACGSAKANTADAPTMTASASKALYEGSAQADGCIKLTEQGAEHLTNDGYSATDYNPAGTWYAYQDPATWEGYMIGGEVAGMTGTAVYSTQTLDRLSDVATLNTQADEAAQIDAWRDTWSSNSGMHPASSRLAATWTPDSKTAQLVDGLAGCFADGRTITLDPVLA